MSSLLLSELLARALPGVDSPDGADAVAVTGVSSDTRTLAAGNVFVCIAGTHDDGGKYARDAVARGAAAVISARGVDVADLGVPVIAVDDARHALGALAAEFHGRPSSTLDVVGITGTNGKTTTAHLIRTVLEHAERGPCALVGTISYTWPGHDEAAVNTTPGAAQLQSLLARARDAGCRSAALEVSSHALDQRRTAGIEFAGAVFTNLSGDHLDYHVSMDEYARAKSRLFEGLPAHAAVAINAEDPYAATMTAAAGERPVIRYGIDVPSAPEVTARDLELDADGARFTLVTTAGEARVTTPLIGRYNVMNLLAAAAVTTGMGVPVPVVAEGLSGVTGVPGRLEAVEEGQPFRVLVDYAHTDDAVANALRNLRAVVVGRLIAVLGCGGDRDRTKRPRMARAAAEIADVCWFTSDNPRTEDPAAILDDMLSGVYGARNVRVEIDRRTAITRAVGAAQVGDCVAILGKGHEDYQILGHEKVDFDDRLVAAAAVRAVCDAKGMALRTR
jgi:UDP-N-acetylmuramyl-tripeptide synthetase